MGLCINRATVTSAERMPALGSKPVNWTFTFSLVKSRALLKCSILSAKKWGTLGSRVIGNQGALQTANIGKPHYLETTTTTTATTTTTTNSRGENTYKSQTRCGEVKAIPD